jgi:cobyric acid synthase
VHGLFDNAALRHPWLASLGWRGAPGQAGSASEVQSMFDHLATHVEASLDMARVQTILWGT